MIRQTKHSEVIGAEFLLDAYRHGFFPMADSATGEIRWYSPDPRGIIDFARFSAPRSLRRIIRNDEFTVKVDEAFGSVVAGCSGREETWISDDIKRSYCRLHDLGHAHSVETWQSGKLVGGLYGVSIGGAFFGESMFSIARNASKVALVFLIEQMQKRGYELLDTQYLTPHLARFGGMEIPREEYLKRLRKASAKECSLSR